MPSLEIRLLGRPDLRCDGAPLVFSHRRETLPLVAYLLVAAGDGAERAAVAADLWPAEPRPRALATLRHAIHRTLASLPEAEAGRPWLVVGRERVAWNTAADYWLDVDELLRLTAQVPRGPGPGQAPPDAAETERLERATALYRGDLLSAYDFAWLGEPRATCLDRYLAALRRLAAGYEATGRTDRGRAVLEQVLAHDPGDEDAARRLMRLVAAEGDRIAALQVYEQLAAYLAGELGLIPEPATTELRDGLRRLPAGRAAAVAAGPPSGGARGGRSLPRTQEPQTRPAIGRLPALDHSADHDELRSALAVSRLVTVVGPPGCGKSQLAQAVVLEWEADHDGGLLWLDGGGMASTKQLLQAMAEVLEVVPPPAGRAAADQAAALVVIDNATHLVEAIATALPRLQASRPQVRILVTSQAPLRLHAERVVRLASPRASDQHDARPEVQLDADDEQRSDLRASPPWHRSWRAACARSVGLLAEQERRLLRALAPVVAGSFSLAEAEEAWSSGADAGEGQAAPSTDRPVAAPAVADLLGALVERSLVEVEFAPDGRTRFRLWPPLVAYLSAERAEAATPAAAALP